MNRALKVAIYGFLIALVVLGCFGGHQLYQRHHLSSDLKRTLTAAMDPAASEADVLAYIRGARLQVHTNKDEDVLQRFQAAVHFAKDSSEIDRRLFSDTRRSLASALSREEYSTFDRLIELRSQYWQSHMLVPKDLQAQISKALEDVKARHKEQQEEYAAEEQRAKDEADTAKKLYNSVRSGKRPMNPSSQRPGRAA